MNRMGIELNNSAVLELKDGNVDRAFQLLTVACEKTKNRSHNSPHYSFRYTWQDCSRAIANALHQGSRFSEGCMPFLCLKFLIIEMPQHVENLESVCPCGFVWVLWYKYVQIALSISSFQCIYETGTLTTLQPCYYFSSHGKSCWKERSFFAMPIIDTFRKSPAPSGSRTKIQALVDATAIYLE